MPRKPSTGGTIAMGSKRSRARIGARKSADTVSNLSREGIRKRMEDGDFARHHEALDVGMVGHAR